MIDKDKLLAFIDGLELSNNDDITTRSSNASTGELDLDFSLRIIHSLAKGNFKTNSSLKDAFIQSVEERNMSLEEVQDQLQLSEQDIDHIMCLGKQEATIKESIKDKLIKFITYNNKDFSREFHKNNDSYFNAINDKLLEKYYDSKKKRQ